MGNDPVALILILVFCSLIPILFILTTSFVKISMVCILARDSLGVQQVPPNIVLYGLSLILSLYVMGPIYNNSYNIMHQDLISGNQITAKKLIDNFDASSTPLRQFLIKHSDREQKDFFYKSLKKYWTSDMLKDVTINDFIILVPAFVVSELTQGFKIGFLIYLPSIIIDIIVSNLLMAMGMMMMSPVTISLPIKLLLFISIDGWTRLINVILGTY
jgi:type III secretion protein R